MRNGKLLIGVWALASIGLSSCMKNMETDYDDMSLEIATDYETFKLPNSNYEKEISKDLISNNEEGHYSEGAISYKINNATIATVSFLPGLDKAEINKDGSLYVIDLKTKKDGSKYKKVIINPLVKTEDCDHIVEGTVKYYDNKTGEYLTTIDYGNGDCDEWVTKTWPAGSKNGKTWAAGSKTFSIKWLK